ncbi:MAG TPA: hypothetical protein VIM54_09945 [Lacisediminihabitans sp.]
MLLDEVPHGLRGLGKRIDAVDGRADCAGFDEVAQRASRLAAPRVGATMRRFWPTNGERSSAPRMRPRGPSTRPPVPLESTRVPPGVSERRSAVSEWLPIRSKITS